MSFRIIVLSQSKTATPPFWASRKASMRARFLASHPSASRWRCEGAGATAGLPHAAKITPIAIARRRITRPRSHVLEVVLGTKSVVLEIRRRRSLRHPRADMGKAKKKQKAKSDPAKKKPAAKRPAAAKPAKKQEKAPARKPVPPPPSSMAITPPPKPPPPPRRKADPGITLKPPIIRVKHAIFGIGRLVREMPEGKIEVQFENVGRKTLLASFV